MCGRVFGCDVQVISMQGCVSGPYISPMETLRDGLLGSGITWSVDPWVDRPFQGLIIPFGIDHPFRGSVIFFGIDHPFRGSAILFRIDHPFWGPVIPFGIDHSFRGSVIPFGVGHLFWAPPYWSVKNYPHQIRWQWLGWWFVDRFVVVGRRPICNFGLLDFILFFYFLWVFLTVASLWVWLWVFGSDRFSWVMQWTWDWACDFSGFWLSSIKLLFLLERHPSQIHLVEFWVANNDENELVDGKENEIDIFLSMWWNGFPCSSSIFLIFWWIVGWEWVFPCNKKFDKS